MPPTVAGEPGQEGNLLDQAGEFMDGIIGRWVNREPSRSCVAYTPAAATGTEGATLSGPSSRSTPRPPPSGEACSAAQQWDGAESGGGGGGGGGARPRGTRDLTRCYTLSALETEPRALGPTEPPRSGLPSGQSRVGFA